MRKSVLTLVKLLMTLEKNTKSWFENIDMRIKIVIKNIVIDLVLLFDTTS
jgi:hypothetical protein